MKQKEEQVRRLYGDRIIVLRKGEIIWDGYPKDIFNVKDEYIENYIKTANIDKRNVI